MPNKLYYIIYIKFWPLTKKIKKLFWSILIYFLIVKFKDKKEKKSKKEKKHKKERSREKESAGADTSVQRIVREKTPDDDREIIVRERKVELRREHDDSDDEHSTKKKVRKVTMVSHFKIWVINLLLYM